MSNDLGGRTRTREPKRLRRSLAWYQLLLRVFPLSFRERFGNDMADVFADRLAAARRRGPIGVVRFVARAVVDAVAHGFAERRRERRLASRRAPMFTAIVSDASYALRLLRRRPAFTAAALATIAIGVGANVAIFSALRAVLLEDLPYPEPDRLVHVSLRTGTRDDGVAPSIPAFEFLQANSPTLRAMAVAVPTQGTLSGAGRAIHLHVDEVSVAMPDVVGLPPVAGRLFTRDDYRDGSNVLLISERLWRSYFGSDQSVIGRGVRLNGQPRTIVGVVPNVFDLHGRSDRRPDLWQPLIWRNGEGSISSLIVARLPPRVDLRSAAVDIDRVLLAAPAENPAEATPARSVALVPFAERGRMYARPGLVLLQSAAGLFLLLGCTNLANLLLVQAGSRRREMGIRAAAGAGRTRLILQALVEAGVIACLGGTLGVLAAYAIVPALVGTAAWALPRPDAIGVGWPELTFGLALAVAATIATAMAPAWLSTRADVVTSLRTSAQLTASRATRSVRGGLVTLEVALALTILATAGLLIQSFARAVSLPLGFDPAGVVIAEVPVLPRSSSVRLAVAGERLHSELQRQLGQVAVANSMPYTGSTMGPATPLLPSGRYETFGSAVYRSVSPEYFDVLRIPIIRGRSFTENDGFGAERVVIVNETFVREFGPPGEIVGARIRLGPRDVTVVGVAGDTRNYDVTAPPQPVVHWLIAQRPATIVTFAIRGSTPSHVAQAVDAALSGVNPDLAPRRVDTLESRIRYSLAQRRFFFLVFTTLAVLGVALGAIGIYAVTSHVAGLRRRELAIRLALGSTHHQVERLLLRQGFAPVAFGVVAGLVGAWWAGEWLSTHPTFSRQLFQITSHDPATVAMAAIVAGLLGALACWLPVRRAGRANPASVLRSE